MSSILKVDTIQDQDGNNIINESANTITIGASGDTITIPSGATLANSGIITGFASTGIDDNATSTAITIDSSENVGIGTTSPVSLGSNITTLEITGGSTIRTGGLYLSTSDKLIKGYFYGSNTGFSIGSVSNSDFKFNTNNTERMRITSEGRLLIAKTSEATDTVGVELKETGLGIFTSNGDNSLIVNRKTSDGSILQFRKDNTTVGSISALGSRLGIGSGDTGLFFNLNSDSIIPYNPTENATKDNLHDLGESGKRFKDLYLGGGLYVGGTAAANKLDDYEEGTITIAGGSYNFNGSGSVNFDSSSNELSYTKIGSMVSLQGRLIIGTITGTPTGTYLYMTGALPFTPADLTDSSGRAAVNIGLLNATIGTPEAAAGIILENSTTLNIYLRTASGNQISNMANGTIYINVTYRAA
jgi:hypothetical protein